MMRAIGFLAGVCLTVAAFLLVVHTVENQPDPVAETPSASTQDERARMITAGAEPVDIGTATPEIQQSGNASTSEPAPQRDAQASEPPADAAHREASSEAGSFLFWSPFRSAWAAEGFARRLTSATQVPVEVVDAGRGEYRVAFRYRDDTERLARISRIETITGLELE